MSKSLNLPSRILKVYIENLIGLSYVYPPDSLSNTFLSGGCVLEKGSNCGNSEQNIHSKDKDEGEEPPVARVQLQGHQWSPTPVFLPGESQGQGSLVGCRLWGRTESDTTEVT